MATKKKDDSSGTKPKKGFSYTPRKLEVYSLHVRNGDQEIDYGAVFQRLAGIEAAQRQMTVASRLVALTKLTINGHRVTIHALEGDVNINPLIFNSLLVQERAQSLQKNEVLVHKTHAIFDVTSRDCVIEYNQRGAKAGTIAYMLEMLARREPGSKNTTVDLNPVINADFEEELNRFDRVQLASVKLARPNADWNDHYNHLTAIAAESQGRFISVDVLAARRQSLSRTDGIVGQIRQFIHAPISMFRAAKIRGVRRGETASTSISLDSYIEHQRPNVRLTPYGHVVDSDIEEKMVSYLDARKKAREQLGT